MIQGRVAGLTHAGNSRSAVNPIVPRRRLIKVISQLRSHYHDCDRPVVATQEKVCKVSGELCWDGDGVALKPVGVGAHIEAQECAQHGTQCGRVSSPWLHGRKWRERLDSRAVVSSHEDIRDIRALSNALTPVVQRNSEEGPKPDPATSIAYRMRHPVKAHALSQ